jgi:hypothetical protein
MKILEDFERRICATTQYVVDDRRLRIETQAVNERLDSYDKAPGANRH